MKNFKSTLAQIICGTFLVSTIYASFSIVSPVDIAGTEKLLKQLDSENYLERNTATDELGKWVRKANKSQIEELQAFSEKTDSPEVRERVRDVLNNNAFLAVPNTRGFIGIQMNAVNGGVMITGVEKGQPADKAGLLPGDVIVEIDGHNLSQMKAEPLDVMNYLKDYVKKKKQGEKLQLKFKRGGKLMEKDLKLGNYDNYLKKFNERGLQGFQGNQLQIQPGVQKFQLNIGPGGAGGNFKLVPGADGQLQMMPQELNKKQMAEMKKLMKELMKNREGARKKSDNLPKMEMNGGKLKLKFNFGANGFIPKPEAKPVKPEKKDAAPKK